MGGIIVKINNFPFPTPLQGAFTNQYTLVVLVWSLGVCCSFQEARMFLYFLFIFFCPSLSPSSSVCDSPSVSSVTYENNFSYLTAYAQHGSICVSSGRQAVHGPHNPLWSKTNAVDLLCLFTGLHLVNNIHFKHFFSVVKCHFIVYGFNRYSFTVLSA